MVFWNTLEIPDPPTLFCSVSTNVFRTSDLSKIEDTLSSAILTLNKSLSQLHIEAALLSRTIYKQKTRFHNDKGLKKLEKVNRGLLKYLAFDITKIYTKFRSFLPERPEEFEFSLPSRQLLEWVLVCMQGFAKLFCVIADTCEETACFWKANIKNGNMCNVSIMIMGLLGRIWSYAKFLVQNTCNWFSQLRPYCNILMQKGIAWLPDGYEIPEDLKPWLKSPHITNPRTKGKSVQDMTQKRIFDLIALEEDEVDCETPYIDNEEVPRKKVKKGQDVLFNTNVGFTGMPIVGSTGNENLGKVIPRNVVKTNEKVATFAHSMSIEDFGVQVPRYDIAAKPKIKMPKVKEKLLQDNSVRSYFNKDKVATFAHSMSIEELGVKVSRYDNTASPKIKIPKGKKKQLQKKSVRSDFDESAIDSNSCTDNIAKSGQHLFTNVHKKQQEKKRKRKLKSSEDFQSNNFETIDNAVSASKTEDESTMKCEVLKLSLAHQTNENGTLIASKKKIKKKSKLDRQHSLEHALTKDRPRPTDRANNSSTSKHVKGSNNQLAKQFHKKKKKGKK